MNGPEIKAFKKLSDQLKNPELLLKTTDHSTCRVVRLHRMLTVDENKLKTT